MKTQLIATTAVMLAFFGAGAGAVNIETLPAKDQAAILAPPSGKAAPAQPGTAAKPAAGKAQSQPADKKLPPKKSDKPS